MSIQDDQNRMLDDEFKVYKKKKDKEAFLKEEEIFWGEDPNHKSDRQVFHIDVGNLPKEKAEDYVNKLIKKYKEKK